MSKKAWIATVALVVLLLVILVTPVLLLRHQEQMVLGQQRSLSVEQGVFQLQGEAPSLMNRLRLSTSPDAVSSSLALEMVKARFGQQDDWVRTIRQELHRLFGLSEATALGQCMDARVLYYYLPSTQTYAAFLSCAFNQPDGSLTVEMDIKSQKITALDFRITSTTNLGTLQSLASQLSSRDWRRRWGYYLQLDYSDTSRAYAAYTDGTKDTQLYYQSEADGQHYSWRPVQAAETP